jgi:hypothetical protein
LPKIGEDVTETLELIPRQWWREIWIERISEDARADFSGSNVDRHEEDNVSSAADLK